MRTTDLDLFPARVKVIDFDPDPELNAAILAAAGADPALNDATTDRNMLIQGFEWMPTLRAKFDAGLRWYLRDIRPGDPMSYEVDAYMFLNDTERSSFTPYHNHIGDAAIVAISYARAPESESLHPGHSYSGMQGGLLVLHDPKADPGLDRCGLETVDPDKIDPRENRMVIQPATVAHSVTPSRGGTRGAVTCDFIIDKSRRWANYLNDRLEDGA